MAGRENYRDGPKRWRGAEMFGLFGLRFPRLALPLIAGGFLAVSAVLGALYYWSPHATLRITTGVEGSVPNRFISTFISQVTAAHPRIRFETVAVPDLGGSAKALEDGKVDIAMVRSDLPPPVNGDTLVILRRDVVAIVLPPESPIDSVAKLSGKTVAIPIGPVQNENSRALDLILSYFNIPAESVKREFLPMIEIGEAVRRKRVAAVLAVGPIGPGQGVDVVATIAKAIRGKPQILAIDDAEAFAARFPGFESLDVPEGAFKAHPAVPDDTVTTLAVTYRFAVPATMFKPVAGAIARSILKAKARLMAASPMANQIEAPDPDEKNPVLPIHPGVADYIANGDQSFFDDFQNYLYLFGIPLSLGASLIAVVAGQFSRKKMEQDQQDVFRLLTIAEEAHKADASGLAELERSFAVTVESCISKLVAGTNAADQAPMSLAIEHARRAIQARKAALAKEITSTA
jgi:TRAP-type uncharacterized transport system substrate-binding protein